MAPSVRKSLRLVVQHRGCTDPPFLVRAIHAEEEEERWAKLRRRGLSARAVYTHQPITWTGCDRGHVVALAAVRPHSFLGPRADDLRVPVELNRYHTWARAPELQRHEHEPLHGRGVERKLAHLQTSAAGAAFLCDGEPSTRIIVSFSCSQLIFLFFTVLRDASGVFQSAESWQSLLGSTGIFYYPFTQWVWHTLLYPMPFATDVLRLYACR